MSLPDLLRLSQVRRLWGTLKPRPASGHRMGRPWSWSIKEHLHNAHSEREHLWQAPTVTRGTVWHTGLPPASLPLPPSPPRPLPPPPSSSSNSTKLTTLARGWRNLKAEPITCQTNNPNAKQTTTQQMTTQHMHTTQNQNNKTSTHNIPLNAVKTVHERNAMQTNTKPQTRHAPYFTSDGWYVAWRVFLSCTYLLCVVHVIFTKCVMQSYNVCAFRASLHQSVQFAGSWMLWCSVFDSVACTMGSQRTRFRAHSVRLRACYAMRSFWHVSFSMWKFWLECSHVLFVLQCSRMRVPNGSDNTTGVTCENV